MARPLPPGEGPGALRRFILPALFVLALFVALFMRRPDAPPTVWVFKGKTMGTTYTVKVIPGGDPGEGPSNTAKSAIDTTLVDVNNKMSTYQSDSELSRFNANPTTDPVSISADLATVVDKALKLSALSQGAFDVTVGPLVNAWGFGPNKPGSPPSADVLATITPKVGYQKLSLDPKAPALAKAHAEMYVDLSAIAKGHGVDAVAAELEKLGHKRFMVEVGGEVRAKGLNASNQLWQIGVEKPDPQARAIQEIVALDNLAMATSGNYRNFYEENGKRISHTINPLTGQPVEHRLASVTVLDDNCANADGLATTLNVLGEKDGFELAVKHDIAALFIIKEPTGAFTEKATPAFERIRKQSQEVSSKEASKEGGAP